MIINRNDLQKKLKALECAISTKPAITAHSYLKWTNDTMITTNGYTSVIANVELELGDEINALIPFKLFKQIIDKVASNLVELTNDGTQLIIKANRARFNLALGSLEQYPIISMEKVENELKINSNVLKTIADKIAFCCDNKDGKKPVLRGVHFSCKNGILTIVGTNAYRLAKTTMEFSHDFDIVIQAQDIYNMAKIFDDNKEVFFGVKDKHCYFYCEDVYYEPTLIDSQYPDTSRLIPITAPNNITLDRMDLIETIDRILMISSTEKDTPNVIKIVFEKRLITISSTNEQIGSASESIECDCDFDLTLGCNGAYLKEALACFDKKEINLHVNEAKRPFTITDTDPTNPLIMLLLPVRIEG